MEMTQHIEDFEVRQTRAAAARILSNPSLLHMYALAGDQTIARSTMLLKRVVSGGIQSERDLVSRVSVRDSIARIVPAEHDFVFDLDREKATDAINFDGQSTA